MFSGNLACCLYFLFEITTTKPLYDSYRANEKRMKERQTYDVNLPDDAV